MKLSLDVFTFWADGRWLCCWFLTTKCCIYQNKIKWFFLPSLQAQYCKIYQCSIFSIPDPGAALTQENIYNLSEIWSGLFIPDPDTDFLFIQDAEVKKAPDPGSTSTTLQFIVEPQFETPTQYFRKMFLNQVSDFLCPSKIVCSILASKLNLPCIVWWACQVGGCSSLSHLPDALLGGGRMVPRKLWHRHR